MVSSLTRLFLLRFEEILKYWKHFLTRNYSGGRLRAKAVDVRDQSLGEGTSMGASQVGEGKVKSVFF